MKRVSLWAMLILVLAVFTARTSAQQLPQQALPQSQAASSTSGQDASSAVSGAVAHLKVYRQRRYVGSALAPSVFVDGTRVVRMGNGRHVSIKLTPGTHTITSDDKSSAITVDIKAGQDCFIRVDEEPGFMKGHGRLTMVMPEQGAAEFKLEKRVEEDRIFAREMIESESEAVEPKN